MSDFKFSCSHCGQHIACNEKMAGRQVVCPNCNHLIRIPAPAGQDVDPESGMTWQTFGPNPIVEKNEKKKDR